MRGAGRGTAGLYCGVLDAAVVPVGASGRGLSFAAGMMGGVVVGATGEVVAMLSLAALTMTVRVVVDVRPELFYNEARNA